jgi:hypothetical protein
VHTSLMGVQRGRQRSPGAGFNLMVFGEQYLIEHEFTSLQTDHLKIDLITARLMGLPEMLIPIAVLGRLYDKVD